MTYPHRNKLSNGSLRVRRVVPPELIPLIGVGTLTRDLKTKDETVAKARSHAPNAELQAIIDRARHEYKSSRMVWTHIDPPRQLSLINLDPKAADRISEVLRREFPDLTVISRGAAGSHHPTNYVLQRADTPLPRRYRVGNNGNGPLTAEKLLAAWIKRRSPRKSSIDFFTPKINALVAWLKYDDLTRVTDTVLIEYVGHLIDRKLGTTTIKNHVQAIKTLFSFALEIKLILTNPAKDLRFTTKHQKGEGRRDFTREELAKILALAREAEPIIRWPNWISAHSGARIEEIARAHKRDVVCVDGVWAIRFWEENRPDDEGLKNAPSSRLVPLHSAILREGFLTYVESLPDGMLFPDTKPGAASRENSKWLRNVVEIKDKRAVFHSHRHTFITSTRVRRNEQGDLRIPVEARIAITGHTDNEKSSVGAKYGEWPIETLKALIERIPEPTLVVAEPIVDEPMAEAA